MSCHTRRGFTLLEMAIVLVIIAVVVGMSITSGVSVIATARLNATQQKMKSIDNAMAAYGAANGRLPCPSDLTLAPGSANYGLEAGAGSGSAIAPGTGACTGTGMLPQANFTAAGATNSFATAAEGALPATTLGLPQDFMVDGWGNKFRYAVDISMTGAGALQNMPIGCVSGPITVNDANGNARTTGAIYALISHGANGHGAYTLNGAIVNANSINTKEQTNCHCNSSAVATTYAPTYVQMNPYIDSNTSDTNYQFNTFDDIVSYKERWQLQTAWDKPATACPYLYASGADTSGNPAIEVYNYKTGAYVMTFGDTGGSAISQARGLTTDSSGNIWLIDPYAGAGKSIKEYSQSGALLKEFGPSCCATSDSNFGGAYQLAVDSSGNVWAYDDQNSRVMKFSSSGSWLMTLGGASADQCAGAYYNATTCTNLYGHTNCCAPNASSCTCSRGIASGQFSNQYNAGVGLAIDGSGNVWAADVDNNRVEEFNGTTGSYINSIGAGYNGVAGTIGSAGTTGGALTSPVDVLYSSGVIWVIGQGPGYTGLSVDEFNPTTYAWLKTAFVGVSGTTGDGAFYNNPYIATFDPSGNLWFADGGNSRIEEFNTTTGTWVKTLGGGNGCAGSYASATSCLTVPGTTSCCVPGASCTCASGNGNGMFPFSLPTGLAIVTSR